MTKFRLIHLGVLFVAFSLVFSGQNASKALASSSCTPPTKALGFSVGSQTRGSVVTLCGHFIADTTLTTKPKPSSPQTSPAPSNPKTPAKKVVAKPLGQKQLAKLRHRRLAMLRESNFSPTHLVIAARPTAVARSQSVKVSLGHPRQHRTAYLLGRFVSLRFTPIDVSLHFDKGAKVASVNRAGFTASVAYKNLGWHTIRGLVTYRADYRLNGSNTWRVIDGTVQLAAIPARVLVSAEESNAPKSPKISNKPLLVANDCLENRFLAGCLN